MAGYFLRTTFLIVEEIEKDEGLEALAEVILLRAQC
jgi:hypothetical protein